MGSGALFRSFRRHYGQGFPLPGPYGEGWKEIAASWWRVESGFDFCESTKYLSDNPLPVCNGMEFDMKYSIPGLGGRLRRARNGTGLSQEAVATKIGVSWMTVHRW